MKTLNIYFQLPFKLFIYVVFERKKNLEKWKASEQNYIPDKWSHFFSVGWVTTWTAKILARPDRSSTTCAPCQSKYFLVRTAHTAFSYSDSLYNRFPSLSLSHSFPGFIKSQGCRSLNYKLWHLHSSGRKAITLAYLKISQCHLCGLLISNINMKVVVLLTILVNQKLVFKLNKHYASE